MKLTILVLVLLWSGLSQAADSVDLAHSEMFSILVLPESRTALVGLVNTQDGMASFAQCELVGMNFDNCTSDPQQRFPFNERTMSRLESAFNANLAKHVSGPENFGYGIGMLLGMGATSVGSAAVYFALKEASPLPDSLREHYAKLFNLDTSAPRFVQYDSNAGSVTADGLLASISEAIAGL